MLKIWGWLSSQAQKPWIQRTECRTWVCADLVPEAGPGTSLLRIQWWVCCINTVGARVINVWLNLVSQTENPYVKAPDQEAELFEIPVFSFEAPPGYHPLPVDKFYFFCNNFIYLLIYLGLHWIFTAASDLLPSCSEQGLLYNCGAQALGSWASVVSVLRFESRGSIVVEHRLSCSKSCGISSDQRLNPRLWHWQADSVPLSHQGSHIILIPGFFLHLLCFM